MRPENHTEGLILFREIVRFIQSNLHRRFCIEIFPAFYLPDSTGSGGYSLLTIYDDTVGIRKKDLIKAYLIARQVLLHHAGLENGYGKQAVEGLPEHLKLLDPQHAAWVALMYDSEHLTAANYLKRRLKETSKSHLANELSAGLSFSESILTSPLHKHSKSPTIWFDRYWLMSTFKPWHQVRRENDAVGSQSLDEASAYLCRELEVVLKAAEQHARNYYAFQYFRRIYDLLCIDPAECNQRNSYSIALERIMHDLSAWCLQHPSDISGLTCLAWLLTSIKHHRSLQKAVELTLNKLQRFQDALEWKGDSLRIFLDMTAPLGKHFPSATCLT